MRSFFIKTNGAIENSPSNNLTIETVCVAYKDSEGKLHETREAAVQSNLQVAIRDGHKKAVQKISGTHRPFGKPYIERQFGSSLPTIFIRDGLDILAVREAFEEFYAEIDRVRGEV